MFKLNPIVLLAIAYVLVVTMGTLVAYDTMTYGLTAYHTTGKAKLIRLATILATTLLVTTTLVIAASIYTLLSEELTVEEKAGLLLSLALIMIFTAVDADLMFAGIVTLAHL